MPSFLLVRQRCRRARRLSVVRAVAAGWARLGDKSLFHQWWANANRKRAGVRPSQTVRRDCWDFGSSLGAVNDTIRRPPGGVPSGLQRKSPASGRAWG
jgi:hypothetical protein